MEDIKIAIISDIHAGVGARAKDLCPKPPKKKHKEYSRYNEKIDDDYISKFINFLKDHKIKADYTINSIKELLEIT